MAKNIALTKIESHEKLCRIMQKQTHDKIHSIEKQINRIESILLICWSFDHWYGRYDLHVNHTIGES
jgi:hypothetical protein